MADTIRWKLSGIYKADAATVAGEIASIGDNATPQQIVDRAKDPNSELHKCFTWDDTIAAEKYRLCEARQVVRLLVIDRSQETENEPPVRVFFKVDNTKSEGYKQTVHIFRNEDEYTKLLKMALAELEAFQRKYRTLSELDPVFDAINEVI